MQALVGIETVVLVLLAVLVAGLLRSHAEILRRLEGHGGGEAAREPERVESRVRGRLDPDLPPARPAPTPAFDVSGTTIAGEPIKVSVAGGGANTLLAFLSSGCIPCGAFWEGLASGARPAIPGDARIVLVTKDSSLESPSRLRELAPRDVTLVMSSAAWDAYGVQGSPYFVYVDRRSSEVIGEGTASAWPQVVSLITDAFADADLAAGAHRSRGQGTRVRANGAERARRAAAELASAGIGPGHPSLYGEPQRSGGAR